MWCQSLSVQVSAWVSADEPKITLSFSEYSLWNSQINRIFGVGFFLSLLIKSYSAPQVQAGEFFTCIKVQRIPNSMCKSDTSRRLQSSLNVCVFLAFPPGFSLMLLLTLLNKHELESKLMSLNLTCQWWNTDRAKAWPCVCVRRSVSKPNESMAGMKALIV